MRHACGTRTCTRFHWLMKSCRRRIWGSIYNYLIVTAQSYRTRKYSRVQNLTTHANHLWTWSIRIMSLILRLYGRLSTESTKKTTHDSSSSMTPHSWRRIVQICWGYWYNGSQICRSSCNAFWQIYQILPKMTVCFRIWVRSSSPKNKVRASSFLR